MIDRLNQQDLEQAPPLGGADVELGNFILGRPGGEQSCLAAARLVLGQIDGFEQFEPPPPASASAEAANRRDPQDWCRRFLAGNGGCVYIDLEHTEVCVPEVTNPTDFVTWWHAMLRIVDAARRRAQAGLPDGQRLQLMVNNSDGLGHSYGAHLSFMLTRDAFQRILVRKPHLTAMLASHQVSSIVYTGQGKVGSENRRPDVDYQISQRADFFDSTTGFQTTFNRPLVNLRDEPWSDARYARLHVIFHDANLCHVASYLKFGVMQVVLSMLAAEEADVGLLLDDPLVTLTAWSHDPDLTRRGRTLDGRRMTAVEHQQHIAEAAREFVGQGRCPLPDAEAVVTRWQETLDGLACRDWEALSRDLDWVLKRQLLEQAMAGHADLDWSAPAVKMLDHLYGNLDPDRGLYRACEAAGAVTRLVPESTIEQATASPPADTRARARAHLLRRAGPDVDVRATWDSVRFRRPGPTGEELCTIHLDDPLNPDVSGERATIHA